MALNGALSVSPPKLNTRYSFGGTTFRNVNRRHLSVRSSADKRSRMEKVIEEEGLVVMPGSFNWLSAGLVAKSGYSAGWISGYAVASSVLGKPECGLLPPPEMAEAVRSICEFCKIPLIVDSDTGGNTLDVQRTIRDLIAAGAAGCFLEDQALPKKRGHKRGKQVISAEEHAAKIAAARDAIGDSDFFLVARTDAQAISAKSGLADAIARVNLYMEAGADASFVEAPGSYYELREIGYKTKGYRVCNMVKGQVTSLYTPEELKEMGFHLIVHPLTTFFASARTLNDIRKFATIKNTRGEDFTKPASYKEFTQLIDWKAWYELECRYSKVKKNLP